MSSAMCSLITAWSLQRTRGWRGMLESSLSSSGMSTRSAVVVTARSAEMQSQFRECFGIVPTRGRGGTLEVAREKRSMREVVRNGSSSNSTNEGPSHLLFVPTQPAVHQHQHYLPWYRTVCLLLRLPTPSHHSFQNVVGGRGKVKLLLTVNKLGVSRIGVYTQKLFKVVRDESCHSGHDVSTVTPQPQHQLMMWGRNTCLMVLLFHLLRLHVMCVVLCCVKPAFGLCTTIDKGENQLNMSLFDDFTCFLTVTYVFNPHIITY